MEIIHVPKLIPRRYVGQ